MSTTNSNRTDALTSGLEGTPVNKSAPARPVALAELEACLESVVVPGDLLSWATALQQACETGGNALRRAITGSHADQLSKIKSEDLNLAQRVVQLKEEDAEILKLYDQLAGKVQRLQERADLAGSREDKLDETVQSLIDEGLALVIRVRKQESAINTWFAEAFQRDTGVGD